MRRERPFYRGFGTTILTSHALVQIALRHPALRVSGIPETLHELARRWSLPIPPLVSHCLNHLLVFMDAPGHTSLRSVLARIFSAKVIAGLRDRLEAQAAQLLDATTGRPRIDLIADLAEPLWSRFLGDWLGLSPDERHILTEQGRKMRALLDPSAIDRQEMAEMINAIETLHELFVSAYARPGRRADQHFFRLVESAYQAEGRTAAPEQIAEACMVTLLGGAETSQALIGNLFLLLGRHPIALDEIRQNPDLLKAAVNETLRLESPLQMTRRIATIDTTIANEPIQAGQALLLCLAAANRDPAVFTQADDFDLHRPKEANLSFGYGPHLCLGMALAKLQAEVAVTAYLARHDGIDLLDPVPQWQTHSLIIRSLVSLPVSASPASAPRQPVPRQEQHAN